MSVNGVTGSTGDTYAAYSATQKNSTKTTEKNNKENTSGVVYESSDSSNTSSTKKTYKSDAALVAKLKADSDARTAQLQSIVQQMISNQGKTLGKTDSIWSFLAGGDFTVDPAVKAQAQADIAEDGYWGVNQTSDRIIDFASALTGGDPKKIEDMRAAFEKGFKQATKTWGKELPEISQQTYKAVMDKFDKLAQDAGLTTENVQ